MAQYIVRDLPTMVPSSSGSLYSSGIGNLDDAESITIYCSTSGANLQLATIEIAQYNPSIGYPEGGTVQSSAWYSSTSIGPFTAGGAITISPVSFRGVRLKSSAGSSMSAGTTIAYVSKQIVV